LHNFLELGIRVLEHKLKEMQNYQKLNQLECYKLPWRRNYVRTKKRGPRWPTIRRMNGRGRNHDFPC